MVTRERTTVVGVFESRDRAERAVEALHQAGFRDNQIGFAVRDERTGEATTTGMTDTNAGEGAATGALAGGAVGAILGAVAAGLVPGIGPVIAGGILASILGGAAVGAATGGLLGALVGMGVPEEEARYYEGEFQSGRTIVAVRTEDRQNVAEDIMRRHGAYNVNDRAYAGTSAGTYAGTGATTRTWDEVNPDYRRSWESRYGTTANYGWTDVEPYYRYGYELRQEPRYRNRNWSEVEPEMRTGFPTWGNRYGYRTNEADWNRHRNYVREGWEGMTERERTTHYDWNQMSPTYRRHWENRYGTRAGHEWREAEPYYRYGYEMRQEPRYRGRRWEEVEPEMRTTVAEWLRGRGYQHRQSDWDRFRNYTREGWEGERTIELHEERLHPVKERERVGEVEIGKEVVSERKTMDVPVSREEVVVERHPVEERHPTHESISEEGEEIRIPLHREEVHVEKRPIVTEEVEIHKRAIQDTKEVSGTVRREELHAHTEGDVEMREGGTVGKHEHRYVNNRCVVCGRTVQPHEHRYVNNVCEICGERRAA